MAYLNIIDIIILDILKYEKVINKAKVSCELSGNKMEDCITDVSKPIITGKGKSEIIKDYTLCRLFSYLNYLKSCF